MKKFLLICISVMTFFAMSLTCFASSYTRPTSLGTYNDSFIIVNGLGGLRCITYNSDDWTPVVTRTWVPSSVYYQYKIEWTKHRDAAYVRYYSQEFSESASNGGWGVLSQYDYDFYPLQYVNDPYLDLSQYFVLSSADVYDSEGKMVFQATPPPTLMEVVQPSLAEMTQNLGGVMKTITLCGVGCLALLIGCSLLRRKSVLWLNR